LIATIVSYTSCKPTDEKENWYKSCIGDRNPVSDWVRSLGPGDLDPTLQQHFNWIADAFSQSKVNEKQLFSLSWQDIKDIIERVKERNNNDVPPYGAAKTVLDRIENSDRSSLFSQSSFPLNFQCFLKSLTGWDAEFDEDFTPSQTNVVAVAWFELDRWVSFAAKSLIGVGFVQQEKERFETYFGDIRSVLRVRTVLDQLQKTISQPIRFAWYSELDGKVAVSGTRTTFYLKDDFFDQTPEDQVKILLFYILHTAQDKVPNCDFEEEYTVIAKAAKYTSSIKNSRTIRREQFCSPYIYYVGSYFKGALDYAQSLDQSFYFN